MFTPFIFVIVEPNACAVEPNVILLLVNAVLGMLVKFVPRKEGAAPLATL